MIPKIFHQIFIDGAQLKSPPQMWFNYANKLKKLHPSWEYNYWNKEKLYSFIKAEYSQFSDYFTQKIPVVIQSDIGRYILLKHFGGWYVDFDYEILRPLDKWNNHNIILPLEKHNNSPENLGNAILASTAMYKFWDLVLESLPKPSEFPEVITHEFIIKTTGPNKLDNLYKQLSQAEQSEILTPQYQNFHYYVPIMMDRAYYEKVKKNLVVYGLHHTHSSWRDNNLEKNLKRRKMATNPMLRFFMNIYAKFKKNSIK